MQTVQIELSKLISLYEQAIYGKKKAQEDDSSWNYGIDDMEKELTILKQEEQK